MFQHKNKEYLVAVIKLTNRMELTFMKVFTNFMLMI